MSTKSDPVREAVAVTPGDSTDIASTRALYVGTEGDIAVRMVGGTTTTFVAASGFLPLCVNRVLSTGTTADDIVALY